MATTGTLMTQQKLDGRARTAVLVAPWIAAAIVGALLAIPATRDLGYDVLDENHVVELGSFVLFLVGAYVGVRLTRRLHRDGAKRWVVWFYGLGSLALFFIGMEEIAWGQWLLGFETPAAIESVNVQGETTLHNLPGTQGRTELLRLAFGFGGLAGIFVGRYRAFAPIAIPPVLASAFVLVLVLAIPDFVNDYRAFPDELQRAVNEMSELVELVIAACALLYLLIGPADAGEADPRSSRNSVR